ncbi:hypothetical protein F2Q68_00031483 [Brassica cretica]|uniref:Uncharacterized protein n=1 Tax=Brassica cretica TaxID=69181 RepID=A0A8S9GA21_BRACR|nr:hypothetical protein F2Q68_00031483 [Brassica cretica]
MKQQCLYFYCCASRFEDWWGTFSSSSIFVVSALFQRVGFGGASSARSEIGDVTVRSPGVRMSPAHRKMEREGMSNGLLSEVTLHQHVRMTLYTTPCRNQG